MKEENKLSAPVLYLIFNRLDTVRKTFPEIQKAKPKQLFIAADGPRTKDEKKKTDEVRKYVLDNINWKCKVKTLFRNKNLGCGRAVSEAIDWFFNNVEEGIILEDDCLPSQSFFRFCQAMLEKYKGDKRIMQISGTNIEGISGIESDYFFANSINAWGWATWRRAWDLYDFSLNNYEKAKKKGQLIKLDSPPFAGLKGRRLYALLRAKKIDTWDYQWIVACMLSNGLCIIPSKNLISNLGLVGGTHTRFADYPRLRRFELEDKLNHPEIIGRNKVYEKSYKRFFNRGGLTRFLRRIFIK